MKRQTRKASPSAECTFALHYYDKSTDTMHVEWFVTADEARDARKDIVDGDEEGDIPYVYLLRLSEVTEIVK